ncbi:MAG: tyrosine-type recombinase/integrase [Lachnospiraceae bacterium]|nr:tyrosine-type recombinase/integrase [Lachnospiraceae bacterium]
MERCGFEKNIVHIKQSLIYKNIDGTGCKFHVWPLKTDAGLRSIPLSAKARKALLKQKELDLMLGVQRQTVDGVDDFVFVNSKGRPYAPNAINSILKNLVGAYNRKELEQAAQEHREPEELPNISAHILRHTACTRMAEAGMEPKVLQYIMGHATIGVTLDVYTHLDFTEIQKKMEDIEKNILIG